MKKWFLALSLLISFPLMAQVKILAFSGSNRQDSYNKKLIREAVKIAEKEGAKVTLIDLKDFEMPLYNGDLEENQGIPSNAKRLKTLLIEHDAIMISTPEYNGSISAMLKNSIDWVSRPEKNGVYQNPFKEKKIAIMSATVSNTPRGKSLIHLRDILTVLAGNVIQSQVIVGNAQEVFQRNEGQIVLVRQELQKSIHSLLQ